MQLNLLNTFHRRSLLIVLKALVRSVNAKKKLMLLVAFFSVVNKQQTLCWYYCTHAENCIVTTVLQCLLPL